MTPFWVRQGGADKLWGSPMFNATVKKSAVDRQFCWHAEVRDGPARTFTTCEEAKTWAQTIARLKGYT